MLFTEAGKRMIITVTVRKTKELITFLCVYRQGIYDKSDSHVSDEIPVLDSLWMNFWISGKSACGFEMDYL